MSITIVIASNAQTNLFEKNKKQTQVKSRLLNQHLLKSTSPINSIAGSVDVPRLVKDSWWDDAGLAWRPNSATRTAYANNRIAYTMDLSYILTDTFRKSEYTYDANGRCTQVITKNYDAGTHTFSNAYRFTYTYYANNSNLTSLETYNSATNTWVPNSRFTTIYDDRGNTIRFSSESYDGGNWIVSYGYSSFITYYNNTSKIVTRIDSNYNGSIGAMEPNYKNVKTYDANGNARAISAYNFDNGPETLEEVDSIYWSNGLPVSLIAFSPSLDPTYKLHNLNWGNTFDNTVDLFENEPLGYETQTYVINTWVNMARTSTTFPDNYGSEINLEEVYLNSAYIPSSRHNFINDAKKNNIEESDESYDAGTNLWSTTYGHQYQYQYDANNRMTEKVSIEYNVTDSAYNFVRKEEYSEFITITTGLNNTDKVIETKLFPNPSTNGIVNIDLKLEKASSVAIELVDINGRLVNVQHIDLGQGLNTVELNGLNKGMYFVIITSDYGVSRTKLLVK